MSNELDQSTHNIHRPVLGMVTGGSLSNGLDVRLASDGQAGNARADIHIIIEDSGKRYLGMITDLALQSADPHLASAVGGVDPEVMGALLGTSTYSIARIGQLLEIDPLKESIKTTRSLPSHFAEVFRATNEDIQSVFGSEDDRHIFIGSPLDMEDSRVCLDVEDLVTRSTAVFGKSGTGKSFMTRILLAGILQKNVAVNLVFDMHSEYGWQASSESGHNVKGLKQLFPSQVMVFTLDEQTSRQRGVSTDDTIRIGLNEIEPEDIAAMAATLKITDLGVQAAYTLKSKFGDEWISRFLSDEEVPASLSENQSTLDALKRRLAQIRRYEFIVPQVDRSQAKVRKILQCLQAGKHVVLEFGRYGQHEDAYLLVANLITRRINSEYRRLTDVATQTNTQPPKRLVITIEEAHRFLAPDIATQTMFGTIAREDRKYRVTLLIVDQRPSGIHDEILSQIGTRVTYRLDDSKDIEAALAGAAGGRELRSVLSRLESQQQSLLYGHSLPMPVVLRTRSYNEEFYSDMSIIGGKTASERLSEERRDRQDLFGSSSRDS